MGLDSRAPGRAAAWALRKYVAGVPRPPKAANPSKLAPVLWAASSLAVRRNQLAGTGSCARDLDGGCAVSGCIAIGRGSYLSLGAGFRSDAGTINPDPRKHERERTKNTTQARSSFGACCNDACVYMPSHGIEVWSPPSGWKQTAGLGDQSVADAHTERLFFFHKCLLFGRNGVHPWEE